MEYGFRGFLGSGLSVQGLLVFRLSELGRFWFGNSGQGECVCVYVL